MEMLTPMVIGQAIGAAKGSGNPRVFIPLHRGAAGFLSDEQFAKYYWPGLKAVIFALLEAGVTPCPFFEGDYTPRLSTYTYPYKSYNFNSSHTLPTLIIS